MVELLIENGADVNARSVSMTGTPAFGPMHSAGQSAHFEIVDLLRAYGAAGPKVTPVRALLASADATKGEEVFVASCIHCHSVENEEFDTGPGLRGVVGRPKAAVEGYKYSLALSRHVGTWTPAEINAFIAAPTDYVPGTSMAAEGVADPMERANLISFLQQRDPESP